jgi:hypothetical protein
LSRLTDEKLVHPVKNNNSEIRLEKIAMGQETLFKVEGFKILMRFSHQIYFVHTPNLVTSNDLGTETQQNYLQPTSFNSDQSCTAPLRDERAKIQAVNGARRKRMESLEASL